MLFVLCVSAKGQLELEQDATSNLVENGDFEQGLIGWTLTAGTSLVEEGGNHFIELLGDLAKIESTFTSVPFQEYTLTLDARGDGTQFVVFLGDTVNFSRSSEWETVGTQQIGNESANQLTITIALNATPDARVLIDNVSLVPWVDEGVPIPAVGSMGIGALVLLALGIGTVILRRQKPELSAQ